MMNGFQFCFNFAFEFDLRRYIVEAAMGQAKNHVRFEGEGDDGGGGGRDGGGGSGGAAAAAAYPRPPISVLMVGRCRLTLSNRRRKRLGLNA